MLHFNSNWLNCFLHVYLTFSSSLFTKIIDDFALLTRQLLVIIICIIILKIKHHEIKSKSYFAWNNLSFKTLRWWVWECIALCDSSSLAWYQSRAHVEWALWIVIKIQRLLDSVLDHYLTFDLVVSLIKIYEFFNYVKYMATLSINFTDYFIFLDMTNFRDKTARKESLVIKLSRQ
jgi:hypothetical protein